MKTSWFTIVLTISSVGLACSSNAPQTESIEGRGQEVVRGPDGGWVTECNGYRDAGPYQICTWNCHHAGNCGVNAGNDGIISCSGSGPSDPWGHAVNWASVPCAADGGACKGYCISEPQLPGSAACCWEQPTGGTINVSSGPGLACANRVCETDGGQVVFEAGIRYDTRECSVIHGQGQACRDCCSGRGHLPWCDRPDAAPDATCVAQIRQFLSSCNAACNGEAGAGDGASSDAVQPTPTEIETAGSEAAPAN